MNVGKISDFCFSFRSDEGGIQLCFSSDYEEDDSGVKERVVKILL